MNGISNSGDFYAFHCINFIIVVRSIYIKTKETGPEQGTIVDVTLMKLSHSKKDLLLLMFSSDVVKSKVF